MTRIKRILLRTGIVLFSVYVLVCGILYFTQESIIFFPKQLAKNFKFEYDVPFEEINIVAADKINLNGLLFKADSAKGLIFYLHGNAGALDTWGDIAKTYTDLNYDIFILDYRGYGKSEGKISSEAQFYSDIQSAYDFFKSRYKENNIVIIGYSIGTGPASMLASKNKPKMLLLQAPYYSLGYMKEKNYPFVPDLILRYKFETFNFVKNTLAPVIIFHGNSDKVIDFGSSLKLKEFLKADDKLVVLEGQGHNGMNENPVFREMLKNILRDKPALSND